MLVNVLVMYLSPVCFKGAYIVSLIAQDKWLLNLYAAGG